MQAFSSHDIFQTLYQQIMLLELKPGSTLRENALCEQFGFPARRCAVFCRSCALPG